jgi:hypothetical protein
MISNDKCGQVNVCHSVPKFFSLNENYRKNIFTKKIVPAKGQGARVEIRRKIMVEATEGCNIN